MRHGRVAPRHVRQPTRMVLRPGTAYIDAGNALPLQEDLFDCERLFGNFDQVRLCSAGWRLLAPADCAVELIWAPCRQLLDAAAALSERLQEEREKPEAKQEFGMAFCEHVESLKSVYVDVRATESLGGRLGPCHPTRVLRIAAGGAVLLQF